MIEIILIYLFGLIWATGESDRFGEDKTRSSSLFSLFWPFFGLLAIYWHTYKLITGKYPDE